MVEMNAELNLDHRDVENMAKENKQYITLKEASELSGYSPDYVGQLIRGGKLHGKQVFQNVAWMTTEEDLRAYMDKRRRAAGKEAGEKSVWSYGKSLAAALGRKLQPARLLPGVLYVLLGLSVLVFLVLFYVFSSSLEHKLDQRAIEKLDQKSSL